MAKLQNVLWGIKHKLSRSGGHSYAKLNDSEASLASHNNPAKSCMRINRYNSLLNEVNVNLAAAQAGKIFGQEKKVCSGRSACMLIGFIVY